MRNIYGVSVMAHLANSAFFGCEIAWQRVPACLRLNEKKQRMPQTDMAISEKSAGPVKERWGTSSLFAFANRIFQTLSSVGKGMPL
jgi:hypothetical protein